VTTCSQGQEKTVSIREFEVGKQVRGSTKIDNVQNQENNCGGVLGKTVTLAGARGFVGL
jgi:hypothetical protein